MKMCKRKTILSWFLW